MNGSFYAPFTELTQNYEEIGPQIPIFGFAFVEYNRTPTLCTNYSSRSRLRGDVYYGERNYYVVVNFELIENKYKIKSKTTEQFMIILYYCAYLCVNLLYASYLAILSTISETLILLRELTI
jgi:hypothetical protein